MRRRGILAGLSLLAGGCTLSTFDALAPRDAGARRVRRDQPYGAGPRQTLDVYAPEVRSGSAPVLVFIYGGSWRSGNKNDYEFVGQAFAAQGFVVVIPDYRLVPQVRFPEFVEDCAGAVAWAAANAAHVGGDPERIVLVGHSAGAYNAIMLALDQRFLRNAEVAPNVVKGAVGIAGPYDFLPFDVDSTRNAFGQFADPAATQPISFARGDAPPLLLLWGERDDLVGRRNIEGLSAAMRERGGQVEAKLYPELDHVNILLALSRPLRDRGPVLADIAAFARRVTS